MLNVAAESPYEYFGFHIAIQNCLISMIANVVFSFFLKPHNTVVIFWNVLRCACFLLLKVLIGWIYLGLVVALKKRKARFNGSQ